MDEPPPGILSMEESEMEMNPDMMHPDVMHPDAMHPDVMHPDMMHPDMMHQDVMHPDMVHPDMMHPEMMHPDMMHPDMRHPDMMHPDMRHPDMMHPDMMHPDMMHPDMMASDVAIPPPPGMEALAPPGTDDDDVVPTSLGTSGLPSLLSLQVEAPSEEQDMRLPQALEQALAFKNQRAQQIGVEEEEEEEDQPLARGGRPASPSPQIITRYQEDEEEEDEEESSETKQISYGRDTDGKESPASVPSVERGNKNKRKKKKRKQNKAAARQMKKDQQEQKPAEESGGKEADKDVQIEYVQETIAASDLDPIYRQFAGIFEKFKIVEPEPDVVIKEEEPQQPQPELKKVPKLLDEYEDDEDEEEKRKDEEKKKLSKRKLKKLTRLSVAELKQLVNRPDVVEMHDVTARDPKLLVQLKAYRNTVPVPRHWCFKRKYLQGKRGIEKPPFDLPEFIKKTGIMEMRSALQEKEDQRTLKAKMRERARPKLGKIDIDYQKLHDAFFKWQTKPRMTIHGDLYYEGKEFETRLKEKKPGDLSDELRTALGMPVGNNAHKVPPPWLIAMQRYGPPPSYPNLKIPGLNAPIPDSCSFGYHAGGWGKPPVDESGKALYGDVFGTQNKDLQAEEIEEEVDRTMWGELESESEEESEEEEEESEEGEPEDKTGLVTPAEGLVTPSGITSIPTGLETPEIIELRKRKIESDMEGGETPALYQVLPEKRMDRVGNAMMASTHIYDMTGTSVPPPGIGITQPRGRGAPGSEGTVELALDPSELDLVDTDAMAARYEQQLREQQSHLQKEDLSDMLADHVARQKSKRKRQQTQQDSKQAKKYKEFKF